MVLALAGKIRVSGVALSKSLMCDLMSFFTLRYLKKSHCE